MGLNSLFEKSGVEIQDDSALRRKDELVKKASYLTMSKESYEDLRDSAVRLGLVPKVYRDARFDTEKIHDNIVKQQNVSGHKFKVQRFEEYCNICNSLISTIGSNQIPGRSYLIGAPNGFGKQSFAVDCILASLRNGWLTVPYISLSELAEIKNANDKVLMRGLMGLETELAHQPFMHTSGKYETDSEIVEGYYSFMGDPYTDVKMPTVVTGRYHWSEYINAQVLICFFSGVESKAIESQMLATLLKIRAAKGLPTIALISTSLDMYEKDPVIGRHIWKEILSYNNDSWDLGRVIHISTFKAYQLKNIRT